MANRENKNRATGKQILFLQIANENYLKIKHVLNDNININQIRYGIKWTIRVGWLLDSRICF
jgi:hypothetical protein